MRSLTGFSSRWRLLQCLCLVLVFSTILLSTSIESRAEESFSYTVSGSGSAPYNQRNYDVYLPYDLDLVEGLESDSLYKVHLNYSGVLNISESLFVRYLGFFYGDNIIHYSQNPGNEWNSTSFDLTFDEVVYLKGSDLIDNDFIFQCMIITGGGSNVTNISYSLSNNLKVVSCEKLSNEDSGDYQNGYNDGYSAGEQAGYGNGYSNGFADGEASVDTDVIYDEAFQAGKDSVDTESFYDAGYQAGYQVAYQEGYNAGYAEGMKSFQGSSFSQGSTISLRPAKSVECVGNPFYVSSYGLVDMEEYQSGANGYFYNTVPGTYKGTTILSYNIPFWSLNGNSYPKFNGNAVRFNFELLSLVPSLTADMGNGTTIANLMHSRIREVYVTYKGKKYYGNYSTSTSFANFDFLVTDLPTDANTLIDGDMTISFVVENSVTLVTDSDVSHYISARYTPSVSFMLGRENTNLAMSIIPYVSNDRVSANIQDQTDKITGSLDEQKEIQQGQLEEQKEQTETQKGIAASIKEFFGSFFDNLINSIIHVIVPTKEEMGELFNRLNDFFSETFGFLYYPFEFIINAFNIFLVADSGTGLTLPAFSIMGYEVWGNQTYDIASEPIVGEIFGFVRMGTGAMLVMWFVNFLKDFFDKRFGGGGN